jgi:succinate dehydrogenase / fumarate reductase flavoprotein subunit
MSESLRNDGRVWVPEEQGRRTKDPRRSPSGPRLLPGEKYPAFGNLVPRDIASRAAKFVCDEGRGVGPESRASARRLPGLRRRHQAPRQEKIEERYGNLFEMYERITGENPYETPMRIYPASHYTMGGLWVDYNLMSTIPGLFVAGEANFSDHGANRLGASALMQGLADGYFVLPYVIGNYLATSRASEDRPRATPGDGRRAARREARQQLLISSRPEGQAHGPTTSTASSAPSSGTTAAWPATPKS